MPRKLFPLFQAASAALLVIGVLTFAHPCLHEDGTVGMCYPASRVIIVLGGAAFVLSLVRLVVGARPVAKALDGLSALCGLGAAFLPGNVLGLCMMETMRCRTVMQPYALLFGCLVAILSVVGLVLDVVPARKAA